MSTVTTGTATATTALQTDHYELTMVDAAVAAGIADHEAVFEVFARRLPEGRAYGVVAGIERLADALDQFRFDPDTLDWLTEHGVITADTAAWLADRFADGPPVTVETYREGEVYLPGSPVVVVTGPYGAALVLETLVLSILNHDSAIASAASRMREAAGDRLLIEMGSRRTHDDAAVAAARAAIVGGFDATSNLAAARTYGIPSKGTAAHAWTLAFGEGGEAEAFAAQIAQQGIGTTLLVDTYDTEQGIRNAVASAQDAGASGPGAVRIDSGDPLIESQRARALLDDLGATSTKVVVTGDLDEHKIAKLVTRGAPIDGFGVGTSLVQGSGAPTAEMVYKLVAIDRGNGFESVAKRSAAKATVGGRKHAYRTLTDDGFASDEKVIVRSDAAIDASPPAQSRSLLLPIWHGRLLRPAGAQQARAWRNAAVSELRPLARTLRATQTAIPTNVTNL